MGEDKDHIEALFKHLESLMNERDRLYTERATNFQQFLTATMEAQKELSTAMFAASKEAVIKAEQSQNSYNASHNDLIKQMDRQYAAMLPRAIFDAYCKSLEEKISDLRDSRSKVEGAGAGKNALWGYIVGVIGIISLILRIVMDLKK